MSRLGKMPINLPEKVDVKVSKEGQITVKGPKGELNLLLMKGISVETDDKSILVKNDSTTNSFHGLFRTLIHNMVSGVTVGFQKKLNLVGIGFKAAVTGNKLNLQLGYSHPIEMDIPKGIEVKVNKNVEIIISGIDKQLVGEYASKIRSERKPEPYKGKGVRFEGEYVRKKAGKAAKSK